MAGRNYAAPAQGSAVTSPILAGGATAMVAQHVDIPDTSDRVTAIVTRLETLANEQVGLKTNIEQRWLENVRGYHGFYDPDTERQLKEAKASRAFVKATRAKTVTLEAKLFDLIFPTDDRNWGIEATPVPKLAKEAKEAMQLAQQAAEKASEAEAAGNEQAVKSYVAQGDDQAARASAAHIEIAKSREAADLMQTEMDDQLIESKYPQESRDMIHDACQLGCGILKGPLVNQSTRGVWIPSDDGFQLTQREDPRPLVKRVDPWSFFPDMAARRIEEAEFTFERYLWSKRDLRKMVKTHGFDADAVRRVIRDDKTRRTVTDSNLTYLTQLRSITGETQGQIKGRFIGWEYHGALECDEVAMLMRAMGDEAGAAEYERNDDPLQEFRVICFFCEGELLKIAPEYPLDSGETLYSVFNIEESEGSIFGYGIPHIMGDSQRALNSAWRMGLDNAGLSVGPQVVIDKDAIVPQDGNWTMLPKKIWFRIKAAVGNSSPPVEFFNVPNNMQEIAMIIKTAIDFIDMETGIPMPQQGEQGAHTTQTFGGMAILQNASNIIFRRIVKNYDDGIITPTMRRLYDWNMQHSPRNDIKGDMSIDARGTSVLLVKEVQAQNLIFIVSQLLSNPNIAPMLKPYENVRKLFQSMMISPDDVMETEDDWKEAVAKMAEAASQQQDPAIINAQSRIEAANIQAKSKGISDEMGLMIAQLRERTALIELANSNEITLEQLRNQLAIKQLDIDSSERKMAAELGFEEKIAAQARARGETPSGSGGFVSSGGGDEQAKAA